MSDPLLQGGQVCIQGMVGGWALFSPEPGALGCRWRGGSVSPGKDKAEARGPLQGLPCSGSWCGCSWLLPTLSLQELFKAFARHLSHSLTQNPCPGRSGECEWHQLGGTCGGSTGRGLALTPPPPPNLVKEEVQDVIKQLFNGRARCESEADWHGLCGPQR